MILLPAKTENLISYNQERLLRLKPIKHSSILFEFVSNSGNLNKYSVSSGSSGFQFIALLRTWVFGILELLYFRGSLGKYQ